MKTINFKVKVKNKVSLITTTIFGEKMSKDEYAAETKLLIQTHMKIKELAEKKTGQIIRSK